MSLDPLTGGMRAPSKKSATREAKLALHIAKRFDAYLNPWETSGEDWYRRAVASLREQYGRDADAMADIIAACSPQCDVSMNVKLAHNEWDRRKRGLPVSAWIPAHAGNLTALRAGLPLRGPKVQAFARALRGDLDACVVDTWILRAAKCPDRKLKSASWFRACQLALKLSAQRAGVPITEAQARVWFAYRAENWIARKGPGDGYLPL